MSILALIVTVCILFALVVQVVILHFTIKTIGIPAANIKTTLKVYVLGVAFAVLLTLLGYSALRLTGDSGGWLAYTFSVVNFFLNFYLFCVLMKKYYAANFAQSLKIYFLQVIASLGVGLVIVLVVILPFRRFLFDWFVVAGRAMEPNFYSGQSLLLQKWDKSFKRGDVVVIKYPRDETQYFIKRIIGLPGDSVALEYGAVIINGVPLDESAYLLADVKTYGSNTTVLLGPDQYFVLGDNRTASSDSRVWGLLPAKLIVGQYLYSLSE